jgi:hypothetical protein
MDDAFILKIIHCLIFYLEKSGHTYLNFLFSIIEQMHSLEQTADELKDRCQSLYKGSKKLM